MEYGIDYPAHHHSKDTEDQTQDEGKRIQDDGARGSHTCSTGIVTAGETLSDIPGVDVLEIDPEAYCSNHYWQ